MKYSLILYNEKADIHPSRVLRINRDHSVLHLICHEGVWLIKYYGYEWRII